MVLSTWGMTYWCAECRTYDDSAYVRSVEVGAIKVPDNDLDAFRAVAEAISRYPGSRLFKEGEAATAAYVIESGHVDLSRSHSGRRRVVARVGPGA